MIAITQDQKQYDQKNDSTNNLAEEMRDRRLALLFIIKIPYVSVHQCNDERRTQQNHRCADVISPGGMDSVNGYRGVERQHQTEKPEQETKPHSCAALQEPADTERDKESSNEHCRCDRISLCLRHCVKHRGGIISEGNALEQEFSDLYSTECI